ncbi:MAG TPA: hypothetical protein VMJ10_05625 [Kofleriaceae bacterium]|nr:hypothetical protein [Kofleriaceae bacterium]
MPRIGELLVARGLLTPNQVEQAVRAQVVWGGRFGTNLVELGLIDLDTLSRALAGQHALPAALAHHFEHADRELQQRFDADLADRFSIVPILTLADGRIAIACMDPLDADRRGEIARGLGIEPRALVVSIAAEQRMRYQLERVYGIARSARFLRKRGQSITPFPVLGDVEVPEDSDIDLEIPIEIGETVIEPSAPPPARAPERAASPPEALAALIDEAAAHGAGLDDEPSGKERRNYVKMLGDAVEAAPLAKAPEAKALGRIAIRRAQSGPIPPVDVRAATNLSEAVRAVRRGAHREKVAELVLDALNRFAPVCDAAMLMVVRGDVVIGWKSFSRRDHAPAELVVPLDQPGLVPNVVRTNSTLRAKASDLGQIDRLLLGALGSSGDGELAVVPIAISGKVMCVIAAALDKDSAVGVVESVAAAAAHAFARLIAEASR